ncbi:MAG: 5-(carboxyamino)imidazole ribonucleotide mutase [Chloroflexi bacterium]|nr:5-(carboxyamino)imidazole ribonucleotide mutase [Chloroflexota bacterium]|tara:strand:- start:16807 stop:17307 length:501 start_codon:yes stop_codon:yes gene_type:complete
MTDPNIEVSVVMGSESDLPTMQNAINTLSEFNIIHEVKIVSAHRTPHEMVNFAENAHERGIQVIIAGAGGAAHLPGMIAAVTTLPVIGVPIPLKQLDGIDSLLSIVQMPRGVPVATVAIGNAENAALLAIRILALNNSKLETELVNFQSNLKNKVDEMNENIKNKP